MRLTPYAQQGIHVLLNNCPKLTHLSLTGVQAFLRDELLAFCREAPPEFNDHQRDVFCVFSGTGVGRLREFLNQQKAHSAANEAAGGGNASLAGSVVGDTNSEMGDAMDDPNPDSDGVSTPVLNMNVQGLNAPGATPVVPTPQSAAGAAPQLLMQALQNQTWLQNQQSGSSAGASNLSQSAPAATGGPGFSGGAGPGAGLGIGGTFGGGSAQHVTGMMGAATILDEVDEGDEAFGEGSEIMEDRD